MCNFTSLAWSYYNIVFQWMNQLMTMASYSYVKKILFHIFGGYCGRFFKSMFFEKLNPTEHLLLICLTQSVGKTSNSSPWPLFHLGMSITIPQYKADQLWFLLIPFIVSGTLLWNQFLPAFSTRVIYLGLVFRAGYYSLKFEHICHCKMIEPHPYNHLI